MCSHELHLPGRNHGCGSSERPLSSSMDQEINGGDQGRQLRLPIHPKPPIMARAKGAYCSAPASVPRAMGIMPNRVASEVIRIGRRRILQDCTTESIRLLPPLCSKPANSTIRILFDNNDASHHDYAHQRHDVQSSTSKEKNHDHPGKPRRNSHENNEGIDEGGKLRHQDQIGRGRWKAEARCRSARTIPSCFARHRGR